MKKHCLFGLFISFMMFTPAFAQSIQGMSYTPSFMRGWRTTVQSSPATGNYAVFSAVDQVRGSNISLNTSTGVITLKAGHSYDIRGSLGEVRGSDGTSRCRFVWYNITGGFMVGTGAGGDTNTGSNNNITTSVAYVLLTPTVDTQIALKIIDANLLTALGYSSAQSYPSFTIQEL